MNLVDILILSSDDMIGESVHDALKAAFVHQKIEFLNTNWMTPHDVGSMIKDRRPKCVIYHMGAPPHGKAAPGWEEVLTYPGTNRPYVLLTTNVFFKLDRKKCPQKCVSLLMPFDTNELVYAVEFALGIHA